MVTPVISPKAGMPVSGDDRLKQVVAARTTRPGDRAVRLNMMDYGDIRLPHHQNLLSGRAPQYACIIQPGINERRFGSGLGTGH